MRWHTPSRRLAQFWLGEFNDAYATFARSEDTDDEAAAQALQALQNLLERDPECADLVTGLVVVILFNHRRSLAPDRVLEAVGVGQAAERLRTDTDSERRLQRLFLFVTEAEAYSARHEQLLAVRSVTRARDTLDAAEDTDGTTALERWLNACAHHAEAQAWDAFLEPAQALGHYKAALETAVSLAEGEVLRSLLVQLLPFLHGEVGHLPDELVRAGLQELWSSLGSVRVGSAVGMARCETLLASPAAADAVAVATATIAEVGLGPVEPIHLVPVIRHADAPNARRLLKAVLTAAQTLGLDEDAYRAVLYAAAAVGVAAAGDDPADLLATAQHARALLRDDLVATASLGLETLATNGTGGYDPAFLSAMEQLSPTVEPRLRDGRIAAVFDEPLVMAIDRISQNYADRGGAQERIHLARLLDSMRATSSPFTALLEDARPAELLTRSHAWDRLARLEVALRDWPDAVALVVRELADETLFVCVSGGHPVELVRADASYRRAAGNLKQLLEQEIDAIEFLGAPGPDTDFAAAGREAFAQLPARVRELVAAFDVILICPDHRTGGDAVPYELFHDGAAPLGVTRTVARYPSLAALTRSAEGSGRRDPHLRALVLAVSEAGTRPVLRHAMEEAGWVRGRLQAAGWDAPDIEPSRVSPTFLLDRLPLVSHVHIAAHGEVVGHEEALILADGTRLRVEDLLGRFFPRMPAVYLNTCSLASSRYQGAGVSRGIALALVEQGSPAVVANLLPVEDEISAELARQFYAQDCGFGQSLRRARADLSTRVQSPALWSTTVLIGDPRTTLQPRRPPAALAERILNSRFTPPVEESDSDILAAAEALLAKGDDPRLEAAMELLTEAASWTTEANPADRESMASALWLALELEHLPAAALIATGITETLDNDADSALQAVEECLSLLEPLEHEHDLWRSLLTDMQARWMRLKRGERAPGLRYLGPEREEDSQAAQETRQFGEWVMNYQMAQEARAIRGGYAAVPREEQTVADVCWNAVIGIRTYALEDMPEKFSFARRTALRLAQVGAFPHSTVPIAATAIAGLLPWLWDNQHPTDLPADMAKAQSGTLQQLVLSLQRHWPPSPSPWHEMLSGFPAEVSQALDSLNELPYGDALSEGIARVMQEIEAKASALLEEARERFPERLPDTLVWITGTLIEKNIYSWIDGSVPEELGNRLERIYNGMLGHAEDVFMPWLMEGFEDVRNPEHDELSRWRWGLESEEQDSDRRTDSPQRLRSRPLPR